MEDDRQPLEDEELRKIKLKVDAREEARRWIQKKRQERYEAQLAELEAKRREEELKRQNLAEFAHTMQALKKKATVNKAPGQRPPSLLSKMHKASHSTALLKTNITKAVHTTEKVSPKVPLTTQSPRLSNVKKSSKETLSSQISSRKSASKENLQSASKENLQSTSKENLQSASKENLQRASKKNLQSLKMSQTIDSKVGGWLLKADSITKPSKGSPARSAKESSRSSKASGGHKPSDGLFSSRAEKQQILESCKSSIMKPVIAPPIKPVAPPTRPQPKLSMSDLQGRSTSVDGTSQKQERPRQRDRDDGMEKEAHKRKTDQEYVPDLKKSRHESRSVLVSSVTTEPNAKYYHFSYVDPPTPSPLNVSMCSEFNETSSSRALHEFNSKVKMLKQALSQEFTRDAVISTLEKSLDKEVISKLNQSTMFASRQQENVKTEQIPSQKHKSSRHQSSHKETAYTQTSQFGDSFVEPNATESKENRQYPRSEDFDMRFKDPTPFNFTSAMKARLNMLTSEKYRENIKKQQSEMQREKPNGKNSEEDDTHNISDQIVQYVDNCERNVAQLRAWGVSQQPPVPPVQPFVASTNPLSPNNRHQVAKREKESHQRSHPETQFDIFTHSRSKTTSLHHPQYPHDEPPPIDCTYERALKPLPLNVEDLKLHFRTTSNSTSSSCFEFSELHRMHSQSQCLNTSQIPERDSGESSVTDNVERNETVKKEIKDVRNVTRRTDKQNGEANDTFEIFKRTSKREQPTKNVSDNTQLGPNHGNKFQDGTENHRVKPNHKDVQGHPTNKTYDPPHNLQSVQTQIPTVSIFDPDCEQGRKKSAFYVVPPSQQLPPHIGECLTQPDFSLSPRRKQAPLETNFRRISSTPTSSLKSMETFKDSYSLSEIMQPEQVERGGACAGKEATDDQKVVQSKPNATSKRDGKASKSIATQSLLPSQNQMPSQPSQMPSVASQMQLLPSQMQSLPSQMLSQPSQMPSVASQMLSHSSTSDTLCDPLTEISVSTADVKAKAKSIFSVKNLSSPKFSLELLESMIKAEEERQKQSKLILKLKSKAVTDRILSELSRLETEKKAIKESLKAKGIGSHGQQTNDKLRNLKKRQRGLLMKLNQEREHLNAMSKQLLSQSQERIQELTSQYNHLRAQLDTKAILKVIDDSFRFHDDVTDSDVTTVTSETPQPGVLDMKLPSNVGKLKAFSSLPEGLDRGDMGLSKSKPDSQYLDLPIQPKVLKDQCTSPLRLSSTELSHDIPSAPVPPTHNTQTAPVPMRAPLYPKYLRRLSSGSDDSFIYSHNETISDQSDLELRIRTLKDQLNKRKLESERLKKELKSVRAENLKAKEASLLQQIRFYDKHIQVATQELENEKENGARPSQIMMKPLILKPQKKMAPKNANTAGGHLNTTNNTNTVANITNMSVNMSSLEETSDQTHSSHDYHKEPFDTESDKLDASDSTNVNKSNDSLEPSVQTITEEDHTMVDAAGETIGSNEKLESLERRTLEELEKDTIKTDISNGQITKPLAKLDRDVSETAKETDDHTKTSSSSEILEHIEQSLTKDLSKESAIKNVSEESAKDKSQPEKNLKAGVSLPKDEEVSELSEVSTHQSETSEIQTELESLRNEIVEEILSSARSVLEASEQTHETETKTETVETNRTKYDSIETAIESVRSIEADTKTHIDSVETAIESVRSIETDIKTHIDSVKTEQSTETNTTRTKHIDSIETAQSKKKDIKTPIDSVQTSIETARSLDSKTEGSESHIEDRASESDGYEEKNYESEVLQVSFREKTINETFIIHEESLSFERKPGDRVANESDVIEELSEVASSVEEDSPELKPLELSPKETATGIEETEDRTTGTADSKEIDQLSLDAKDKVSETGLDRESANEHKSSPEMLLDEQEGSNSVLKITSSIEATPLNGTGTKQSNIVESNPPNATGTKPTTILDSTNIETPLDLTDVHNTSDILSPNISDLDFLPVDKDFLRLDNYALPLINLSPSKAPETPFLHALKRDYQMSRQIQLEQISNDIVKEELNASIESIVGLYNAGRENASDKARGKLVRAVSVREDGNEGEDKDEGGDEGKEVEEEVQDEADDSLEEKVDFFALSSHQKELSWTSEDDWYNEDFGLTLQGPPAIVAEVLLQKERQIDQEIEKIKQLTSNIQSLTDPIDTDPITRRKLFSGAYPYLREIPDKPPPPYIEPACSVPASEPEITGIIEAMVQSLMCPEKQIEVPSSNIARIQMYYSFLYDLTRDVYTRQTTPSTARCEDELPWQQPRVKAKLLDRKVPSDTQVITSRVVSEVCQLLALRPSPKRDNFIARWSRPKRDPVDEIIVQESKAEEPMWTGFHVEETEIKNQIADAILQDLLAETAVVFRRLTAGRSQA